MVHTQDMSHGKTSSLHNLQLHQASNGTLLNLRIQPHLRGGQVLVRPTSTLVTFSTRLRISARSAEATVAPGVSTIAGRSSETATSQAAPPIMPSCTAATVPCRTLVRSTVRGCIVPLATLITTGRLSAGAGQQPTDAPFCTVAAVP